MFNAIIGQHKEDIATPALLIDVDILDANLKKMAEIAKAANIAYRPHAKSHKQPLIAHKQLRAGANGICCAKLSEAEVMVEGGIGNILITSPVVAKSRLCHLAALARHANLAVVADSEENVADLDAAARRAGARLGVVIEVDVGQARCGISSPDLAVKLATKVTEAHSLDFHGLQGYYGNIQLEPSATKRRAAARAGLDLLLRMADHIRSAGIEVRTLTGGGTGTLAIDIALGGLSELQPGSYVFMDSRYSEIEWPASGRPPFRSSLTVLATVISRPTRNRAVLDSGWKSVSNDSGNPVAITGDGIRFRFAGDEHAVLEHDEVLPFQIGNTIELIPSHCDTTLNLYDHCYAIRSEVVEAVWPIPGRGKIW